MYNDNLEKNWKKLIESTMVESQHNFNKVYADAARDENGRLSQTGNGHAAVQTYVQENLDWSAAEKAIGEPVTASFKKRAFFSGTEYSTGKIHCCLTVAGREHWGYAIFDTNTLLVIGWDGGQSSPGMSNTVAFSPEHIQKDKWVKMGRIGPAGINMEVKDMFNQDYLDKEAKRKPFEYQAWMR